MSRLRRSVDRYRDRVVNQTTDLFAHAPYPLADTLAYEGDPTHPVGVAERLADSLGDARLEVATESADIADWHTTIAHFLAG